MPENTESNPTRKDGKGRDMFVSRLKFTSVSSILCKMSSFQPEITKTHKEARNNSTHMKHQSVEPGADVTSAFELLDRILNTCHQRVKSPSGKSGQYA